MGEFLRKSLQLTLVILAMSLVSPGIVLADEAFNPLRPADTGSTVDNMALRKYRRVRTILHLGYDTPADRVEAFIEAIKQIIQTHPHTLKDRSRIWLDDFGEYGLHIVVNFFLDLSDTSLEKLERQKILLEILKLAESMAIQFVVPPLKPQAESTTA